MATLVVQQHTPLRSRTPPPPLTAPLSINTSKVKSVPIPNKHLPFCSPGPTPKPHVQTPATPPASPPSKSSLHQFPILHPENYSKVLEYPAVYSITAASLATALDHLATDPLPEPKLVFPWLHGLHQDNQVQLAFFTARRKALRKAPKCLRGITVVKAGGDLSKARLKSAVSSRELLSSNSLKSPPFLDVDPKEGFSVRNFHIQTAKLATISDIVIYGDKDTKEEELHREAKRFARAQMLHRQKLEAAGTDAPVFHTFVVSNSFDTFEKNHPDLVAIDSEGCSTGRIMDFFQLERQEMYAMSKASEIAKNVYLGPTPDPSTVQRRDSDSGPSFDILIEASDLAQPPHIKSLRRFSELSYSAPQCLEFPSSGSVMPLTWSHSEVDGLLDMCHWIYQLTNPEITPDPSENGEIDSPDSDGDIQMKLLSPRARKVLIHCTDGYTESSLLGLAYFMFAECVPVHQAWIRIHCEKKRNFFAYPSDVTLLSSIQPRLMQESPRNSASIPASLPDEPSWLKKIDGSLPSRILPYMYLGNLCHANNLGLLKIMGIGRILSIGEPVTRTEAQLQEWGADNLLFIDRVQDNGVDPLDEEIEKCLKFIRAGKLEGSATLVHCRVGVSRSATICIAEVMASMNISFPRAYCFVRARRLNVIIQPHLRFAYELLKWEESLFQKRGLSLRRELEWAAICREIAAMNKPYMR